MLSPLIQSRWGKSEQGGDRYHLLVYHMLDVAAVLAVGLKRRPDLLAMLARRLRLPVETTRSMLLVLTALHDLGKCVLAFQAQREDVAARLGLTVAGIDPYDPARAHHACVGQALLLDVIEEERVALPLEEPVSDSTKIEDLFSIFSGHHGFQPPLEATLGRYRGQWRGEDKDAAAELVEAVLDLFAWRADMPGPDDGRRISYLLNGLVTICDWLGSNAAFALKAEAMALFDYWERHALPTAETVVANAKIALFQPPARPHALGFRSLFPGFAAATPLQAELDRILAVERLPEGPFLIVIEDLTGAGKTEAADLLAHQLLAAGRIDGVYYGLPTMATADAAWERKEEDAGQGGDSVAARVFGRAPARVLAHAKRHRNPSFRNLATRAGQDDGEAAPLDWLARSNKRALLAELGIGTVDQALVGALRTRHATVRLAGLWRKLLVVDEVHAYDDYMQGVLEALLRHQAMLGQHVLLMSATLPSRLRARLIQAFGGGAGWPDLDARLECLNRQDLPLLGLHHASDSEELPIAPVSRPGAQPVQFRPVHEEADVIDWLVAHALAGRSAIWFRNTVDDAISAFQRLKPLLAARCMPAPLLYHARFLPADRAAAERRLLDVAGKMATPELRRGRLIVATQAAEQSLDLDIDELVSDLAPADVLIQRLGRRRRHPRHSDGTRADDGVERRPGAEVLLHLPPLEPATDDWFRRFSPGAAIYPDTARLWLTARHLLDPTTIPGRAANAEGIVLERDARPLLESVYGEDEVVAAAVPCALRPSLFAVAGSDIEDRRQAFLNRLPFTDGLLADWNRHTAVLADEDWAPTRLGESYELLLAVSEDESFRFLEPGMDPLEDSVLRVPWPLEIDPADRGAREALARLLPDERSRRRFAFRRIVVLRADRAAHSWIGTALRRDRRGQPRSLRIRYCRRTGLQRLTVGEASR